MFDNIKTTLKIIKSQHLNTYFIRIDTPRI